MSLKKIISLCFAMSITLFLQGAEAKIRSISSPNGRIKVDVVNTQDEINIAISLDGEELMHPSNIGLILDDERNISWNASMKVEERNTKKETVDALFYRQKSFIEEYNVLRLKLSLGFSLEIRVFDEGVAYRFLTKNTGETIIKNEQAIYDFGKQCNVWMAHVSNKDRPFVTDFQSLYSFSTVEQQEETPAFLPITIDCGKAKATIMEAELKNYPGMFMTAKEGKLQALFAQYPSEMGKYEWRGMTFVQQTENFIARTTGERAYPWRIIAIADDDRQMPVNNLVYTLSEPNVIESTDWIKPGKVAWDWWNDWNVYGVDFKSGINTDTYKYYIDFAAKHSIEYIVLDEGWYDSKTGDIMTPIEDIDLPEIVNYAKNKGVGVVLWTVFNVLDEHLDEAMDKYKDMGVKGFKVDFLDRDDQTATEMAYRIASAATKRQLILDYHGFYKPTGMSRTFPNLLNYEGVFGMEEVKWTTIEHDMPLYEVTFPYIRMQAGQTDYTPGAMSNATKNTWKAIYSKPMSMGTRCHQMACYIVHDSPFTMLSDAPASYEKEPEWLRIIASIPTVYDKTIIPMGKIGEYIVTAREKNGKWYIAGQTNWDSRDIDLVFDFIDKNTVYTAEIMCDGANAERIAEDYRREIIPIKYNDTKQIHLAPGGGFIMILNNGSNINGESESEFEIDYSIKPDITGIPEDKNIPDFYKKYTESEGIYVTASDKVCDQAMQSAYQIIKLMLVKRPDIKEFMAKKGCHIMIIGKEEQTCDLPEYAHICDTPENISYWNKRARGFGGAPEDEFSASCGEENLLALPEDKYLGENILVHEFAHIIHTIGIRGIESDFDKRLEKTFQHAKDSGLWENTYAMSDQMEYFAECVQSFFNCNRCAIPTNGVHNEINNREKLKAYDTMMYNLLKEYFAEIDCAIIPQNNQIQVN